VYLTSSMYGLLPPMGALLRKPKPVLGGVEVLPSWGAACCAPT
jgi:hypothetical protein